MTIKDQKSGVIKDQKEINKIIDELDLDGENEITTITNLSQNISNKINILFSDEKTDHSKSNFKDNRVDLNLKRQHLMHKKLDNNNLKISNNTSFKESKMDQ